MVESPSVLVGDVRMRWVENGTGSAVVLLHGFPTSPVLWRRVAPLLEGVRVLAWEMVGYGESIGQAPGLEPTIERQADWFVAWCASIGLDRAVLVGHDVGGAVAALVALREPGLVSGLVLVDSAAFPVRPPFPFQRLGGAFGRLPNAIFGPLFRRHVRRGHDDLETARDSARLHWRPYSRHAAAKVLARQLESLRTSAADRVAEALPLLARIPARVIWGTDDPFRREAAGRRLARELKTPFQSIERARHYLPEDRPEAVAEAVSDLVRETRGRRRWATAGAFGRDRGETDRIEARRADLLRGRVLVATLRDILPEEADDRIRTIYEDVRSTLHVPIVNLVFRTLANDPDYLESAWRAIRPLVLSPEFEAAADDLRGKALLEPAPEDLAASLAERPEFDRVRDYARTVHYVLPKLLLIATALDLDLADERPGSAPAAATSPEPPLPPGILQGALELTMVDPTRAGGSLERLLEDIRRRHGHPGVATFYRALGRWPDFLGTLWSRIRPFVGSSPYLLRRHDLIVRAESLLSRCPPIEGSAASLSPGDRVRIRSIVSVFRYRLVPDLLLDVSLVRAMIEGPDEARTHPFATAESAR